MNSIVLVLLGALLALTSAASSTSSNATKLEDNAANKGILIEGRSIKGRSLSSRGQKIIREFLNQMPLGFPEIGVPALAPFLKEELEYQIKESFAEINANFKDIRIEGLDDLLTNHFEVTYVLSQNIKYNFTFPRIIASGKYSSDSTFDLIKEFGISVRHYGKGNFEVILENLTFQGYFKYTMPLIYGSISIYNFDGSVALENVLLNIGGLAGKSIFNNVINDKLEDFGVKFVRSNQELINNMVKEFLIPLANKKLHGRNVWSLIG